MSFGGITIGSMHGMSIYYDPKDPSYAYLERKVQFFPSMGMLYGCIFFAGFIQWLVEFAGRIASPPPFPPSDAVLPAAGPKPGHLFFGIMLVCIAGIAADYLWIAPRPYDVGGLFILAAMFLLMPFVWWKRIRNWRRFQNAMAIP